MLMTAGLGTRLRPYTERVPKPLLPLMGVAMAQFALDQLLEAGVSRVVANAHHQPERLALGLRSLDLGSAELAISDESALLLGSAGGIRKALPLLGVEPFYYVNADVLNEVDLRALALRHRALRSRWGVLLTLAILPGLPSASRYRELFLDDSGDRVAGLGAPTAGRPFFASAAVIEPEALASLPEGVPLEFVPEVLEPAIRSGRAGAYLAEGGFEDIGSPELWLDAHVSMLGRLETGRVPQRWRRRIESVNRRVAPGIWVSKKARRWLSCSEWSAPAYWSPAGDPRATPPAALGPRGVLYGTAPKSDSAARFSNRIDWS